MTIWSVLLPKVTFYVHLVHFVVIWYIFPRFGMLYREKSGNPGSAVQLRWGVGAANQEFL
jgi:hypothetical protein